MKAATELLSFSTISKLVKVVQNPCDLVLAHSADLKNRTQASDWQKLLLATLEVRKRKASNFPAKGQSKKVRKNNSESEKNRRQNRRRKKTKEKTDSLDRKGKEEWIKRTDQPDTNVLWTYCVTQVKF